MKNQHKNILLICKTLPWSFKGGIQTHTWELARSLWSMGHQITILTSGAYRKPEQSYNKEQINIVEIPYFPGRYIKPVALLAEELSFNIAVKKWVRKHHKAFDIIHSQGRSGYLLSSLLQVRNKLVTTVHGLISDESRNKKLFNLNARLHSGVSSYLERKAIQGSSECLAVSRDLQNEVAQRYLRANLNIIPNGVTCQDHIPQVSKPKAARFLFVGRLHQVKGILPLVEAMSNASTEITLDIIGNGPLFKPLQELIKKKALQHKVRLLGEHDSATIQKVLPYYQALVLPSFYETQGIVLLEAHAQAIPVIASDIPAIRETVAHQKNGLLCNPNKSWSFINAMHYIIENPKHAQAMGEHGRKQAMEHYSWQSIASRTVEVYQKMAS